MPEITIARPDPDAPLRPTLEGAAGLYVTGEDNLRVQTFNAATGVTIQIGGRFIDERGELRAFVFSHTPNSDRTVASSIFRLGNGWIQNVYAIASAGAPLIGQTFVLAQLVRGQSGAVTELGTLLQGMVTATQRLAWPGSSIASTIGSPGALRFIAGTDPAAGAEVSETVPTGARWKVKGVAVSLATDATATNRVPSLVFDNGTAVVAVSPIPAAITASLTVRCHWNHNSQLVGGIINSLYFQGMPMHIQLPAGSRIRTVTTNLQPGDNYAAPLLLVEEQIEGA